MVFATVSSMLWIVAAIYCIGYMRSLKEHAQTRFFASFAVSLSAAVGGAFAANLFTLVIFYEALSLITYPLVYHKEDEESWHGSRRYMVYLVGASKTFLLAGLALTYQVAGTLDFKPTGLFDGVEASDLLLSAVYLCYLAGFAKGAIMPFHAWLPAAMVAPTPVSALLHAVAVVKMGVFCILRLVFHVMGVDLMGKLGLGVATAYLVSFTIITASIYALTRDDLKARLAYSTVSQLSYIVLGAVMLSPLAMVGGHHPYRRPRAVQDHALFLRRIHLLRVGAQEYQRARRHRPQAALDHGGLLHRLAGHDRGAANGGVHLQVVPGVGLRRRPGDGIPGRAAGELPCSTPPTSCRSPTPPSSRRKNRALPALARTRWRPATSVRIPLVTIPLVATAILSLVMGVYPGYFLTLPPAWCHDRAGRQLLRRRRPRQGAAPLAVGDAGGGGRRRLPG